MALPTTLIYSPGQDLNSFKPHFAIWKYSLPEVQSLFHKREVRSKDDAACP